MAVGLSLLVQLVNAQIKLEHLLMLATHLVLGKAAATDLAAINGNMVLAGTLTVNGNQAGATDHVFDEHDDIALLRDWRQGKPLPFPLGDLLNRDRLLRDTIIQEHGHRLAADTEREAMRAEIAELQSQLDQMERRG